MHDARLRVPPLPELLTGIKACGFFEVGAGPVVVSRAPGRLDVMGGIADYSGSLVCEMPLALATAAAGQARSDGQFVCQSGRRGKSVSVGMKELAKGDPKAAGASLKGDDHWAKYVAGCAWWLIHHGKAYAKGDAVERAIKGATVFLQSDLPLGGGVSSSAAIEVASMTALAEVWGFEVPGLALAAACQVVENRVVGAPCGVMDQVASCLGEEGTLLKLLCQPGADGLPAQVKGVIRVPEGFGFVGVHSGVRHEVSGDPYTDTRVAAFMGQKILSVLERLDVTDGWLARVGPKRYCTELRQKLPVELTGEKFLDQYGSTNDGVTRVDPRKVYPVRAATSHHVLESRRVRRFAALLEKADEGCGADCLETRMRKAGRLMLASHWSYGLRAGMGHEGTDRLVKLAMELGPVQGFYGAKITGGGCGGTVAMLISRRRGVRERLSTLCEQYTRETGRQTMLFDRSGPGAAKWGVVKMNQEDWA
ncbi:MAG: hypothetical protein IT442_09490 [Phycisphaeraceae bacterium]|nr:hypothetical protein [Phycisphaeraceae bacterium]